MTSKVSLSIGVKYKPFKSKTHSLYSPQHLIKPSGLRSANSGAPMFISVLSKGVKYKNP